MVSNQLRSAVRQTSTTGNQVLLAYRIRSRLRAYAHPILYCIPYLFKVAKWVSACSIRLKCAPSACAHPMQLGLNTILIDEPKAQLSLSIPRAITRCAVARKRGHDCVVLGCAAYVAVMQSHGPM